jgi:hypothetical protein
MQNIHIYKQFTIRLVCGLMVCITTLAVADSPIPPYSIQLTAERGNPWAWPQTPENDSDFQKEPRPWEPNYPGMQRQQYNQNFRFVTPEILESLKQQQSQSQMMPENKPSLKPQQSIQNYRYPSFGMGYTNPSYRTPTAPPWGTDSNLLYSGDSFPMPPKEAIDGFSPFQAMPFSDMNDADDSGSSNIFNPFSFGRYGNLQ